MGEFLKDESKSGCALNGHRCHVHQGRSFWEVVVEMNFITDLPLSIKESLEEKMTVKLNDQFCCSGSFFFSL